MLEGYERAYELQDIVINLRAQVGHVAIGKVEGIPKSLLRSAQIHSKAIQTSDKLVADNSQSFADRCYVSSVSQEAIEKPSAETCRGHAEDGVARVNEGIVGVNDELVVSIDAKDVFVEDQAEDIVPDVKVTAPATRKDKKVFYSRRNKNTKSKKPTTEELITVGGYKVIREYVWAPLAPFDQWWRQNRNKPEDVSICLPIKCLSFASARWFDKLYMRYGWLSNEHVDVLLNMIVLYYQTWSDLFLQDWTVIEAIGTECMLSSNFDDIADRVLAYVEGNYPQQGSKPWKSVNRVFGVAHVGGDHWVAYMLNLLEQAIYVYDSNIGDDGLLEATFGPMKKTAPKLCFYGNIYEARPAVGPVKNEWLLVMFDRPPQQVNNSDCGVLAIKFIECLATGTSFSVIDPDRCLQYRKAYCAEMFSWPRIV